MNDKIQYNASKFGLSSTIASSAAGYMEQAKASAGAVKSTVPSDFSLSSSAISSANEIETVCSKAGFLTSTFNYWKGLIGVLEDEAEVDLNGNVYDFNYYLNKIGSHEGSYQELFGMPLLFADLKPGLTVVPSPKNGVGGYAIWIPENYDSNTPVPLSVIFHASDKGGYTEILDMIKNGEQKPNSILFLPIASGSTYDVPAGSLSFPNPKVQNWILEGMEALMTNYNIDMDNISVSGYSSGIRGALEFARNNPDYISDVYSFDQIGKYDYTGIEGNANDPHTQGLAIQNVKDLSDAGVSVTIYSNDNFSKLYEGYDNVHIVKIKGGHETSMTEVFETTDYLDRIFGKTDVNPTTKTSFEILGKVIKTPIPTATPTPTVAPTATPNPTPAPKGVTVTEDGIGIGVGTTTSSPTPTPTPTAPPASTPTPTATPTATTPPSGKSSTDEYNELREEIFDLKNKKPEKVEEEPKDPVEEEPEEPTTPPPVKDKPKEPSTPPAEPTTPEPTYILPENKFSELIPNLTSGTLDSMEITATTANYELSGITDAIYNDYINSLKTAGYTLGADGSWINGNYILNLVRNNTDLNIYFKINEYSTL